MAKYNWRKKLKFSELNSDFKDVCNQINDCIISILYRSTLLAPEEVLSLARNEIGSLITKFSSHVTYSIDLVADRLYMYGIDVDIAVSDGVYVTRGLLEVRIN